MTDLSVSSSDSVSNAELAKKQSLAAQESDSSVDPIFLRLAEQSGDQKAKDLNTKFGEGLKNASQITSWQDLAGICDKNLGNGASKDIYSLLEEEFFAMTGQKSDLSQGDWSVLKGSRSGIDFTTFSSKNPLLQVLNKFLEKYEIPPKNLDASFVADDFFEQFFAFITAPALISLQKTENSPLSYESTYQLLAKNPNREDFEAKISAFYDKQVEKNGYFIPGHDFASWVQELKTPAVSGKNTVTQTSATGKDADEESFSIMMLLTALLEMTSTLQQLAVVQANRLQMYTSIESEYTKLEGEVPYFKQDGNKLWGTTKSDAASFRGELNTTFSQVVTSNLQAERGQWEDAARSVQSQISGTTKEVESQTDIMQKVLDMINSLMSQMFR